MSERREGDTQHTKIHQVVCTLIVLVVFAFIVGMMIGLHTSSDTQVDREPTAHELLQRIP